MLCVLIYLQSPRARPVVVSQFAEGEPRAFAEYIDSVTRGDEIASRVPFAAVDLSRAGSPIFFAFQEC